MLYNSYVYLHIYILFVYIQRIKYITGVGQMRWTFSRLKLLKRLWTGVEEVGPVPPPCGTRSGATDPTVPAMSHSRRNREPLRTTHLWLIYQLHPSTSIYIHLHPSTSIYIHLHPSTSIYIHLHPSTSIYSESTQCIVVIWGFDSPSPPLYTDKFPDCADFWEFQLSFFLKTEVVPYSGSRWTSGWWG